MKWNVMVLLAGISALLFSCKHHTQESAPQADRGPMVQNMANAIILPRYTAFNTNINTLSASVNTFTTTPTMASLQALRADYMAAYKSWQEVSCFNFGPASGNALNSKTVNLFPSDTAVLKAQMQSGSYDFNLSNGPKTSGFPAIDYLLYGKSLTDQQIIDSFTVGNAAKRSQYLKDVMAYLKGKTNTTYTSWSPTGSNVTAVFAGNTGVDLGSSTSQIINMMVADLEYIKNYKLGVPLNIFQNIQQDETMIRPFEAEAFHSDSTLVLLKANIESVRRVYMGISTSGVNGAGLDDYLESIHQSALNSQIQNQFALIQQKINAVNGPFSAALASPSEKATIKAAYTETQKLVALLKVDLSSAVGVMISYADNDGD